MRRPAAAVSVGCHVLLLAVLFSLRFHPADVVRAKDFQFVKLSAPPRMVLKDGGGGQRQALPASRGRAPMPSPRKFHMAPAVVHNDAAKLILDQGLVEIPTVNIASTAIGDPLARSGPISGGIGGPVGVGNGGNGGVGDGNGARQGGFSEVTPTTLLTRRPEVIYKEEPEYSEEARRARYEGTVVIAFDVDANGRPVHLRVVRSLGLGLDEKALAAVSHWRFRPAEVNGKKVNSAASADVTFRLL